ncbi:MAG: hypothetical protein JOY93_03485 [Acidobacteriales bacterium]|nr:hypothetical protein [Terriglobales bacterium]
MPAFLGLDGGGTKTSCVIGDERSVLGSGSAGGSNIVRLGESVTRNSLATAILSACEAAKVSPAQITNACLGLAGAINPEIREAAHRLASEIIPGKIEIVGDMEIAFEAAFGSGPGVIVISGTGSIAYARNSQGEIARAGGWGFAASDQGSGYWIGREAVAAAMRSYDTGERSLLLGEIMTAWNVSDFEQLVLAANASPLPDFSLLFPAVLAAFEAEDSTSRVILTRAGTELAALAKIVRNRLFQRGEIVPMAMSGGVFQNCQAIRQVFYNVVCDAYPNVALSEALVDPVMGALTRARR